jgi:hypothetical protein
MSGAPDRVIPAVPVGVTPNWVAAGVVRSISMVMTGLQTAKSYKGVYVQTAGNSDATGRTQN